MQHDFVREPEEGFVKRLLDHLKTKVSKNITFEYTQVIKTNDVKFPALIVHDENRQVGKTVYLDELLKRFSNGVSLEEIANQIVSLCNRREPLEDMDGSYLVEQMKDWQYLLDGHINFKLINREKSQKYLEGKTYLPFLDLAIVFCMTVDGITNGTATVAIPAEVSKYWGVGLEEAFKQALEVVEKIFPIKRRTLKDMMFELVRKSNGPDAAEEIFSVLRLMDTDIQVQTNTYMVNGAITMLYNNSLSQLCKEMKTKFLFLIPSSLHEVLILKQAEIDGWALKHMVEEVNATQVADEEILSNNIYVYNDETKEITVWEED